MGNVQPNSEKLKIFIDTQKAFYNSGSSIEGAVFIQAKDNFQFDALYIRVEGQQYCQWFEGSSKNRRKHTGNQIFYVQQHILQKYPSKILQAGHYTYPFVLELSQNMPGSYESHKYNANIKYKLMAYFTNYTDPKHRQIYFQPLLIREPFRLESGPVEGSVQSNPTSYGCLKQGKISIFCWFQRNVCFQGDNIKLEGTVDNSNGDKFIKNIKIVLAQYTFVAANSGIFRNYRKIQSQESVPVNVAAGKNDSFKTSFKIPAINHQTAISTLVANYFKIQVFPEMGYFFSDVPIIVSPIFVMKKHIEGQQRKPKMDFNNQTGKNGKIKIFRAPEYIFRKNENLSILNFKEQDAFSERF